MKQQIFDAILRELEVELDRLNAANQHASTAAVFSAPHAEKQHDTSGFEAAYLAHGYSMQCNTLARQIDKLRDLKIEDFSGQEIDIGALVEVEVNGDMGSGFTERRSNLTFLRAAGHLNDCINL